LDAGALAALENPDYRVSTRLKFWLITAAALLALVATLSLGRWQLSRAAQKEAMHAAIEKQGQRAVLDAGALAALENPAQAIHRRITLRGAWVGDKTIFLDNRLMHGKFGFYVVTPFHLEGSRAVVLVQRGWVLRNFMDRASVPKIDTPAGLIEVQGRIAPPPAKLYELGASGTGLIRQNLDLAQFSAESGLPLMAVSIQQTGAASDGLARDWPEAGSGVEKNYGYAFQWFGLSSLIAILYVWFQIVRRFLHRRRA